jgi:hypothetical protein
LITDSDPVVILKSYDVTGYLLARNNLKLSEIESVIPFTSTFPNPFLKEYQRNHIMNGDNAIAQNPTAS